MPALSKILLTASFLASTVLTEKTYDYVIAGGGAAGFYIATLLSEDSSVSIAVLEAGGDSLNDPRATDPDRRGDLVGSAYDWNFSTTPQAALPKTPSLQLPRGRTLGGSAPLAYLAYARPSEAEINLYSNLLNITGWSWSSVLAAFKKTETFTPARGPKSQVLVSNLSAHGTSGPIQVTWQKDLWSFYTKPLAEALSTLGVKRYADHDNGNTDGPGFQPVFVDASTYTRSDSATAFAKKPRPNVTVLTGVLVQRIVWSSTTAGSATASGLEYIDAQGKLRSISAKKVVVAAGVQSPPLLERSGVGNATFLRSLSITPAIDNPAVGANFQGHLSIPATYKINTSFPGGDHTQNYQDWLKPSRFLSAADYKLASSWLEPKAAPAGVDEGIWKTVKALWKADDVFVAVGFYHEGNLGFYNFHPLSSGSSHTKSKHVQDGVLLDLGLGSAQVGPNRTAFDVWVLSKAAHYWLSSLSQAKSLKRIAAKFTPDPSVPFEAFQDKIIDSIETSSSITGGASLGKVVDESGKLKETANVWVGDASILPNVPGAFPLSLTYAAAHIVAEALQAAK